MYLCNDEEKSNPTGEMRMKKWLAHIVKRTMSVYCCKGLLGMFIAKRPPLPTHLDSPCQVIGLEREPY